jgi:hypothetical protein
MKSQFLEIDYPRLAVTANLEPQGDMWVEGKIQVKMKYIPPT